jgi:hypothetical protein
MIDIRNLKEIKNIDEFDIFCAHLESFERKWNIGNIFLMKNKISLPNIQNF